MVYMSYDSKRVYLSATHPREVAEDSHICTVQPFGGQTTFALVQHLRTVFQLAQIQVTIVD